MNQHHRNFQGGGAGESAFWRRHSGGRDQSADHHFAKRRPSYLENGCFDADVAQAPGRVAHLPTILRYAMLATRAANEGA